MARVGVFVCHCGSNIAAPSTAARWRPRRGRCRASSTPRTTSTCAPSPGQKLIQDDDHGREARPRRRRLVLAAHARADLPAHRGRGRRQSRTAWRWRTCASTARGCTRDKPVATAKAVEIVGMLVAKALRDEALRPGRAELTKRLLVIGGGIAGIQAALDVANAGYEVTLVERTPTIGGKMAMLDKTFPTLDCSACILTPADGRRRPAPEDPPDDVGRGRGGARLRRQLRR